MHNQQYALPNYSHKGSCRASVSILYSLFLAPQELSDSEYRVYHLHVHTGLRMMLQVLPSWRNMQLLVAQLAMCELCSTLTGLQPILQIRVNQSATMLCTVNSLLTWTLCFLRRSFSQIFLWITRFTITWLERDTRQWMSNMLAGP